MGSDPRHLALVWILAAAATACGHQEFTPSYPPTRGLDEIDTEDRPPRAFFGGTSLIDLTRPDRCAHVEGDLEDVTFRWVPSGEVRVYVAVMREEPRAAEQQLENPEDVIWVWTTAGDRSDSGFLTWAEGFAPGPDGLPASGDVPSLDPGRHRLWLVSWAWDERRELSHSSEIRPFFFAPGHTEAEVCCDESVAADPEASERWYDYWCRPLVPADEADDHPAWARRWGCADRESLCGG